jgi:hypothetical protein
MRVETTISAPFLRDSDALPKGFTPHDWAALPLETRMACLLFDALAALDGIRLDLQTEEGPALRWIDPHLRALSDGLETALKRLAS